MVFILFQIFKIILKISLKAVSPSDVYINRINNRLLVFKMKDGYKLEL